MHALHSIYTTAQWVGGNYVGQETMGRGDKRRLIMVLFIPSEMRIHTVQLMCVKTYTTRVIPYSLLSKYVRQSAQYYSYTDLTVRML